MGYSKCCIALAVGLLTLGPYLSAKNPSQARAEQDRLQNAGLDGSTLRPDVHANRKLYGKSTSAAKIILESDVPAPDAAHDLIAALQLLSSAQALAILVGTGLDCCHQERSAPERAVAVAPGGALL